MRHLMTGTAGAGFWALRVLAQKAQSYFAILKRGSSKIGKELRFAPFLRLARSIFARRAAELWDSIGVNTIFWVLHEAWQ